MAKRKKSRKITLPVVILSVLAVCVISLYYFNVPPLDFDLGIGWKFTVRTPDEGPDPDIAYTDGELHVDFIDVGQGDSILIRFPDGKNMLIDGGDKNKDAYSAVAEVLTEYDVTTLDYVMLTHTDADHCGSLDDVIASDVTAKTVYMPYVRSRSAIDPITTGSVDIPDLLRECYDLSQTTYGYIGTAALEDFVLAAVGDGADIKYSLQGEVISGEGYTMTFYTPEASQYALVRTGNSHDINNVSPIVILEFNGVKIMFTGDVSYESGSSKGHERGAEGVFLDYVRKTGTDVDVDVLKVAHHGSSGSSCRDFLNTVLPEYAIISVGEGNSYGHPHQETLNRLAEIHADVYTTMDRGNIMLTVNSEGEISFEFEKGAL